MNLFDSAGNAVQVPDAQVKMALLSGQYGLPAGSKIPVQHRGGQVEEVPVEEFAAKAGHARMLSPAEYDTYKLQKQYGDVGHQLEAGATGVLKGATLGLSDEAIAKLGGPEVAEQLRKTRQANPLASTGGEIVGALAPILATEGAAAPEAIGESAELANEGKTLGAFAKQAIASPTTLAMKGGEVAAQTAKQMSRLITENETAGRVLGALARGSVEGGVLGAEQGGGDYLSESALGNTDLNGEKMLAAMGHGALLGAGAGAALTGAGELGREVLGRAASHLDGVAEEQAWRSLSARKAFVTEAEKIPGGARAIGRKLIDDGIIEAGDSLEEIAPKVSKAREAAGAEIGDLLKSADEAGYQGPKLAAVYKKIDEDVLPRLNKLPSLNGGAINKIEDLKDDLARAIGLEGKYEVGFREARPQTFTAPIMTFQQAQDLRARLDDAIKWTTNPLAPHNEVTDALKGARAAIEQSIEEAGDAASRKFGGSFLKDYKAAKLGYRQLKVADQAATDALDRALANRKISLTDYIAGGAGHALGGGLLAAGHPLAAAASLASGLAHHVIRERGNATAAVVLDKLGSLQAVRQSVMAVDRQMDRGVAAIFEENRAPMKTRLSQSAQGYKDRVDAVKQAAENPEAHSSLIARAAASFADHAPGVAKSFRAAAERATAMLIKALPVESPPMPMMGKAPHDDVPLDQKAAFMRVFDAVHDPSTVLRDTANGTLTKAQVDAFEAAHPNLYAEQVVKVKKKMLAKPISLPLDKRLALSTFTREPLDPTLVPDTARMLQANWLLKPKPMKQPQSSGKHKALGSDISESFKLPGQGMKSHG